MVNLYRPDGTVLVPHTPVIANPAYAPFDFVKGELLAELGPAYTVVPVSHWMDTPVLDQAMARAKDALKGYKLAPIQAEILVQEYRSSDKLLVIIAVWGKAPGKATWQWHFTPTVFDITGPNKTALVLAGRWTTSTIH